MYKMLTTSSKEMKNLPNDSEVVINKKPLNELKLMKYNLQKFRRNILPTFSGATLDIHLRHCTMSQPRRLQPNTLRRENRDTHEYSSV
jgi:hypothetical protein